MKKIARVSRDSSHCPHRGVAQRGDLTNLFEVTTNDIPSVTLVRHGESTWNELGLIQGQNNTAQLTPRGREEARNVAESLRGLGFQVLITSDLDRARESADIIGSVLGPEAIPNALVRERGFGVLEGRPLSGLTLSVTGIEHRVMVNPDARPQGGESFREVVARARLFVKELLDERPRQHVLVVSHGGMIRALLASVNGQPLEGSHWHPVGNASVWRLAPLDPNEVSL